jgi:hypothetical protein
MTHRFTAHEPRPYRGARPKEPAPTKLGKAVKPGEADAADVVGKSGEIGRAKETGGPSGPEPTRYGDWERKGICVDF